MGILGLIIVVLFITVFASILIGWALTPTCPCCSKDMDELRIDFGYTVYHCWDCSINVRK